MTAPTTSRLLVGITLTLFSAMTGPAFAATMYAVSFNASNSPVYTIDSVTGTQTLLGNSGVGRLNSLAATPSGVLYSAGGPSQANQNHLITINPATGVGTDLGTITFDVAPPPSASGITALAADASGNLYGAMPSFSGPQLSALYRIDPATRLATQVTGNMGGYAVQALEFSSTGILYGTSISSNIGLLTIDPVTGVTTQVGPRGGPNFQSIAFGPDGTLWGAEITTSGRLYTIDATTGASTLAFSGLNNNLRGIEFLAPVPVPAAVWLFGSGLAAMAGLARRNKGTGSRRRLG